VQGLSNSPGFNARGVEAVTVFHLDSVGLETLQSRAAPSQGRSVRRAAELCPVRTVSIAEYWSRQRVVANSADLQMADYWGSEEGKPPGLIMLNFGAQSSNFRHTTTKFSLRQT
jgi:hypothetical protein